MAFSMDSVLGAGSKYLGKAAGYGIHHPFQTAMGYSMYAGERDKGKGMIGAGVSAVATNAFYSAAGGAGVALMAVQAAGEIIPEAHRAYNSYAQSLMKSTRAFSKGFQDTQASYTMRQRALQEIQSSRLNARTAMGNEAQYMHR